MASEPAAGTVLGIGIDLVEISRFSATLERFGERVLRKLFTEEERRYCDSHSESTRPQHFAARFAAKEAWIKASGIALEWKEIEVQNRPGTGAPDLILQGRTLQAAQEARIGTVHLTLTHAGDLALAQVTILGR